MWEIKFKQKPIRMNRNILIKLCLFQKAILFVLKNMNSSMIKKDVFLVIREDQKKSKSKKLKNKKMRRNNNMMMMKKNNLWLKSFQSLNRNSGLLNGCQLILDKNLNSNRPSTQNPRQLTCKNWQIKRHRRWL